LQHVDYTTLGGGISQFNFDYLTGEIVGGIIVLGDVSKASFYEYKFNSSSSPNSYINELLGNRTNNKEKGSAWAIILSARTTSLQNL
jgi:hypothetical protein